MPHRPSESVIGWWLVSGAAIATVGYAVLYMQRPDITSALGIVAPVVGPLVLWALAVAIEASVWRLWTVIRPPARK